MISSLSLFGFKTIATIPLLETLENQLNLINQEIASTKDKLITVYNDKYENINFNNCYDDIMSTLTNDILDKLYEQLDVVANDEQINKVTDQINGFEHLFDLCLEKFDISNKIENIKESLHLYNKHYGMCPKHKCSYIDPSDMTENSKLFCSSCYEDNLDITDDAISYSSYASIDSYS